MLRSRPTLVVALTALAASAAAPRLAAAATPDDAMIQRVVDELNEHPTVAGTDEYKSFEILFDAYLEMDDPPFPVGDDFNLTTIWPGMDGWSRVSGWAESSDVMAKAVMESREKNIVGLPYGRDNVEKKYLDAGIFCEIGVNGSLLDNRFPYLDAVDTIAAYVTAEVYRRMEAGDSDEALDLAVASLFVFRQFCDRDFLDEKLHSVPLLSRCLQNLRDVFYTYQDEISVERFTDIAWWELPFLRPDRNRLLMPEADRVISEALIDEVFDPDSGAPDPERFARLFSGIQSSDMPLTRFGAAKRWGMISTVHGSLDASKERLALVYDDWWRRWRVQEYDPILDIEAQFNRTNRVRYAAVIFSMQDIEALFAIRNQLIVEVNGTAVAAGLCAYRRNFDTYPAATQMIVQFSRKRMNVDPYDKEFHPFKYMVVESASRSRSGKAVDTAEGRMWLQPGEAVLWSLGQDHEDNRADEHADDGFTGDIMMWPPAKAYGRVNGYE